MNYLELLGTLCRSGLFVLEYRASIYLWLACIVMPAIYLVVYYRAGLYADFGINIYYLLASIYGWIVWKMRGAPEAQGGRSGGRCFLADYLYAGADVSPACGDSDCLLAGNAPGY